jgi:excisionase family DNA binding protein
MVVERRPLPEILLTVAEMARVLRCGKTRAQQFIRSGEIPSILVGGTLRRVRLSDLEKYLEGISPAVPTRSTDTGPTDRH